MIENETSKAFLDERRLAMLKARIARFMEVMQGDGEEASIAFPSEIEPDAQKA